MAKALTLNPDDFAAAPPAPQAAKIVATQPLTSATAAGQAKAPTVPKVPLQVLITKENAKAIKRAAVEADLSYSDFIVSCFHKAMKA